MSKGNLTFTMIKPVAVKEHNSGKILAQIEEAGFTIRALRMVHITKENAAQFYGEHKGKPFYEKLIEFISSGPIVAVVLEKENAVEEFRKLIGATDPTQAAEGTIRKLYAKDKTVNAIHGADSDESAQREISFFFNAMQKFN